MLDFTQRNRETGEPITPTKPQSCKKCGCKHIVNGKCRHCGEGRKASPRPNA